MSITNEEIVEFILKFVKKNYKFPTRLEMVEAGYSRDLIRSRFGSLEAIRQDIIESNSLPNYITDYTYGSAYNKRLKSLVKTSKVFIISSFVCGTTVNKKFLNNLKALAKHHKGQLLMLPLLDKQNKADKFFDPELLDTNIVTDELWLNSNLLISNIAVAARAVDPSSGLPRIGQRNGSTILGSTKQRLKYVPTGISTMPHALMSTGAVSNPEYSKSSLFKSKAARLAEEDHKLGAIIVEIVDDNIFHFRNLEAGPKMEVIDLGIMARDGRISKVRPSALILGDWHSGKTNSGVAQETMALSKKLGIKKWVLHDVFDGDSINHHDNGKHITRAKKVKYTGLNISYELSMIARDLRWMLKSLDKVVIVRSNHDEFLDLYLNTAKYVEDPHNHAIALELAIQMLKGRNPLQHGVVNRLQPNEVPKVSWLERDESYKISGVECGHHGDAGANGARPSIQSLENAYKKAVTGHSHTPQILRDIYVVGTSTDTVPDYGKGGPNSWMNTHCIIYPNGTRQLINLINNAFTNLW